MIRTCEIGWEEWLVGGRVARAVGGVLPCARWEGLARLLRWKVVMMVVVMGVRGWGGSVWIVDISNRNGSSTSAHK